MKIEASDVWVDIDGFIILVHAELAIELLVSNLA